MTEQNQGGLWVPEVAYVDMLRDGWIYRFIRFIGDRFILLGAWVKSFGYYQVEIHPKESLLEAMKKIKAIRND